MVWVSSVRILPSPPVAGPWYFALCSARRLWRAGPREDARHYTIKLRALCSARRLWRAEPREDARRYTIKLRALCSARRLWRAGPREDARRYTRRISITARADARPPPMTAAKRLNDQPA